MASPKSVLPPSKEQTFEELKRLHREVDEAKVKLQRTQKEVDLVRTHVKQLEAESKGEKLEETTAALMMELEEWLNAEESDSVSLDEEVDDDGQKAEKKGLQPSDLSAKQLIVAEKNMKLFHILEHEKQHLERLQKETETFRTTLLVEVAGEKVDPKDYSDISTVKLLELYKQKLEKQAIEDVRKEMERPGGSKLAANSSIRSGTARPSTSHNIIKQLVAEGKGDVNLVETEENPDSQPSVKTKAMETPEDLSRFELERQIESLKNRNKKMQKKIDSIKGQVEAAGAEQGRADALQKRNEELGLRLNQERDQRLRVEEEIERSTKKVAKLAEHIERLMTHLKHESTAKLKHQKVVRRMEEELGSLRLRSSTLLKKMKMREQVISELKEGSKILEEQLRLMDNKYVDMRRKLDWTRDHTKQQVKKMSEEADLLRARWQLAGGSKLNLSKLVGDAASKKTGSGRKAAAFLDKSQKAQEKMVEMHKNL
eukprot:g4351.t1